MRGGAASRAAALPSRRRGARAYRGPTFGGLVVFLTLATFLHRPVRTRTRQRQRRRRR
jgi:hypothetical protein